MTWFELAILGGMLMVAALAGLAGFVALVFTIGVVFDESATGNPVSHGTSGPLRSAAPK